MGNRRLDSHSLAVAETRDLSKAGSGEREREKTPTPLQLALGRLGAENLLPSLWKKVIPSEEEKCEWMRSQIPGRSVEFTTAFGTSRLLTYADHTASGQPLIHIEDIVAQALLPFYGNTHTEDSHVGKVTGHAVQEAGQFIKRCLGGTKVEAIFFCGSGTTAALKRLQECLGIAVPAFLRTRVLRMLDDEEKWVVFVGPYEHHSNLLSWRESLAEVVEIPLRGDGSGLDMRKLRAALANPKYRDRPKLGSFSAASNVTGMLTDTRAITRLLHQSGAFACFDFAASGPYVNIDMRAGRLDGYDAVVLSPHKFMGVPGSPGILLMSKELYLLKDTALHLRRWRRGIRGPATTGVHRGCGGEGGCGHTAHHPESESSSDFLGEGAHGARSHRTQGAALHHNCHPETAEKPPHPHPGQHRSATLRHPLLHCPFSRPFFLPDSQLPATSACKTWPGPSRKAPALPVCGEAPQRPVRHPGQRRLLLCGPLRALSSGHRSGAVIGPRACCCCQGLRCCEARVGQALLRLLHNRGRVRLLTIRHRIRGRSRPAFPAIV